jgi:hypothetical protein
MPEKISYQQLQPEERLVIASLRLQDVSIRAMARILGARQPPLAVNCREIALRLAIHPSRLKR